MSHPTRVRGLKREGYLEILSKYMSHPTRVRGLKQLTAVQLENPMKEGDPKVKDRLKGHLSFL